MSRTRVVTIASLSVTGIYATLLLFGKFFQVADVRGCAKRISCEESLKSTVRALFAYADDHGDVPRDDVGEFAPNLLVCQDDSRGEKCVPIGQARCFLRSRDGPAWNGLVWCQMSDFRSKAFVPGHPESSTKKFVVLCHDPECLHRINDKWYAPVALSDGRVLSLVVQKDDYRLWFDTEFLRGNSAIPSFISDQVDLDFP